MIETRTWGTTLLLTMINETFFFFFIICDEININYSVNNGNKCGGSVSKWTAQQS